MTFLYPFLLISFAAQPPFVCGEKRKVHRPYGLVELRVNCENIKGRMWVGEFKDGKQHGISQGFHLATGRKEDSCFYRNDEREGTGLVWDSLGNVVGRTFMKNGKPEGRYEGYYSPGRPWIIKFYQAGLEEGPWDEWWPNGNKKCEFIAKRGLILSGTEYYPDGKPRVRYRTKDGPETKSLFKTKFIAAESWAPDGRPAGRVVEGQGEWLLFPPGIDSADTKVWREVFKDSLRVDIMVVDSAQIAEWFRSRAQPK